jgi:hypothetical protein
MKECIVLLLHASQTLFSATIRWSVNLDRTPGLIDVVKSGRIANETDALRVAWF